MRVSTNEEEPAPEEELRLLQVFQWTLASALFRSRGEGLPLSTWLILAKYQLWGSLSQMGHQPCPLLSYPA